MANDTDPRVIAELADVERLERTLAERLRRILVALIYACETESHLQGRLDVLEQNGDGRSRSAASADAAALSFRTMLSSIPSDREWLDVPTPAAPVPG